MVASLLGKSVRDERVAILGYGVGLALFAAMVVALFPSIQGIPAFAEMLESYPPVLKAFMGELQHATTLEGFLSMELMSSMYPIILAIFAIAAGSAAVAGEEDRGTMDMLLSNPIPRWRVVAEKFAASIAGMVGLALITALSVWASTLAMGLELSPSGAISSALGALPLGFLAGAYALFFSCLLRSRRSAIFTAAAITVASYFLNGLAPLVESLKELKRLSIFHYYSGYDTLTRGIDWQDAGILLGFTALFFLAALAAFERREIYA